MNSFFQKINSEQLTLVDFYATWCGPCKTMAPILSDLKKKVGDAATILKVDVDANPAISQQYRIQGVPTLILFKKGQILWRQSGVVALPQLEHIIHQYQA
ncbi:thioredoxin [Leadbetterella byssophila]|uniref:Thioredoxin n=1 Tax=Leadbetterella byssophila (strain DSM 17132 / JCM 16389 / KACC 11308 / NBRC 106382 / 4M15) TaxID=649349 RepID=E4RT76_LEAB4|nr:thioredoxin [Leadbetterella byssophila]ADQ18614.1 thioredoxin [Leadbetterella byssophila DSM 17132]